MPRFAANLSFLFTDLPFLDRFDAAAKAGFKAVESTNLYEASAEDVAARLKANGLTLALFNTPGGNAEAGERGLGALRRAARRISRRRSRPRCATPMPPAAARCTCWQASCTRARGATPSSPT